MVPSAMKAKRPAAWEPAIPRAETILDSFNRRSQPAAAAAAKVPQVARVYTREQLLLGHVPSDTISRRVVESYHRERSGDLEIILHPFWVRQKTGTTHGTPYSYDSHIPLVIMGPGVRPGQYARHVSLNDVAPTLATALRIAVPAASAGRALNDIIAPSPTGAANSQQ